MNATSKKTFCLMKHKIISLCTLIVGFIKFLSSYYRNCSTITHSCPSLLHLIAIKNRRKIYAFYLPVQRTMIDHDQRKEERNVISLVFISVNFTIYPQWIWQKYCKIENRPIILYFLTNSLTLPYFLCLSVSLQLFLCKVKDQAIPSILFLFLPLKKKFF